MAKRLASVPSSEHYAHVAAGEIIDALYARLDADGLELYIPMPVHDEIAAIVASAIQCAVDDVAREQKRKRRRV